MKAFFRPATEASEGANSTTSPWVKVKLEKAETLANISKLSAEAFNAQYDDLAALKVLNPKIGYLNKAAQVVCTSKGRIYKIGPRDKAKRSPAWTKVGDISASAGVPNLVVCLIDGCFQEVIAHHLTTVQLNHISVADVASFLCSLPALPQGR